jgi:hypothetical protein
VVLKDAISLRNRADISRYLRCAHSGITGIADGCRPSIIATGRMNVCCGVIVDATMVVVTIAV